jgi:hypothetical protein
MCTGVALLRADRWDEARLLLDARLDRRRSPRDARWLAGIRRETAQAGATASVAPA